MMIAILMMLSFHMPACILQHMADEDDARIAIRSLDHHKLQGGTLSVMVRSHMYTSNLQTVYI